METEWIVMQAREKGRYNRVALVLAEKNVKPKMISPRARGIVRIDLVWNRLRDYGKEYDAYHYALSGARAMAVAMNAACCPFDSARIDYIPS